MAFVGIDRHRYIKFFLKHFNNWRHSCNLFFIRDLDMSRTRRFPAYVNDIYTFFNHLVCMCNCRIHSVKLSSIGKGIRRHIQDSHNVCMICCIKILSTYDHIIISIFFSSSFQLHFFSAMQERHILERLSLS